MDHYLSENFQENAKIKEAIFQKNKFHYNYNYVCIFRISRCLIKIQIN